MTHDFKSQSVCPESILCRMYTPGSQPPFRITKEGICSVGRHPQTRLFHLDGVEMTRKVLSFLFLAVGLIIVIAVVVQTTRQREAISAEKARDMIDRDSNTVLLDVRTEKEYNSETGHLAGAKLIPVQELENRLAELEPWKARTIVVYCRSGNRSGRAAALLREHGFSALNMEGGILRWNKLEYPVVTEKDR